MTARSRLSGLLVAIWIAVLSFPNLVSVPVWPWSPANWTATAIEDALGIGMHDAIAALVVTLALLMLLLALARRHAWFAWGTFPFLVLVPVETWYIVEYGQPSNSHVLAVLAEANRSEVSAFVGAGTSAILVLWFVFAILATLAAIWLKKHGAVWSHRSRAWVIAIVGGTTIASSVLTAVSAPEPVSGSVRSDSPWPDRSSWIHERASSYPFGVPLRLASWAQDRREIDARLGLSRRVPQAVRLAPDLAPQDVVLVIGESARADRLRRDGGATGASPRLARTEGVLWFDDVISQAPATRLAVPRIVASLRDLDAGPFGAQPSVVAAFREAGYATWWVSNHSPVGKFDTSITPFAEEAEVRRYLNLTAYSLNGTLDGRLVDELHVILGTPGVRRFVVAHMLGSHYNYRHRYPDEFDRFKPSIGRDEATSIFDVDRKDAIRNTYDNSILYTDHVLAEMIRALEATGRDSVLMYVSDHGQVLFEGVCGKAGHGITSGLSFRVPMLIWMSPSMRSKRADAVEALSARRAVPITTEAVAPTLLDLGGIALPDRAYRWNLLAPDFSPSARRVTMDGRVWHDFERDVLPRDCAKAISRRPS